MGKIAKCADIRERILDAADSLLPHYGYSKMTMEDLAREVGIGKGTVYLHFDSKEAVALAHVDRIVERTLAEMNVIAANTGEATLVRVRKMLYARVLVRFAAVQNYSKSLDELLAGIRSKLLERRIAHFEQESELFAGILQQGLDTGELRGIDARQAAEGLLWATNSLLPFNLSRGEFRNRERIEARLGQVVDLVTKGLAG